MPAQAPPATPERRREVDRFLAEAAAWASRRPDLAGLALVGSWARGGATTSSDVDLVLLADDTDPYLENDAWAAALGAAGSLRTRARGPLTEKRFALRSGLEIDVGVAPSSWAATDPLDPGTRRVARDGLRPLHDPEGLIATLLRVA